MQFRAIATDLDGTIVRSDGSISERTRRAVRDAEDAGLSVVIATGRPPRWIAPVIDALGDRGLVVCANGASVYDPARDEIVARLDLDAEVAAEVVDRVASAVPGAVFGVEQGLEFGLDPAFWEARRDLVGSVATPPDDVRIAPVREFLNEPVTKLLVRVLPPVPEDVADLVQRLVGDRALVTHSMDESFLELSNPLAHKATTVERLLLEASISPGEVVAFGDMPNDLELIRWARLGVAVANAHPMLRAAADEVTASNDEDGVAMVIERILSEA